MAGEQQAQAQLTPMFLLLTVQPRNLQTGPLGGGKAGAGTFGKESGRKQDTAHVQRCPQELQTPKLEGAEGDSGKGGAAWTGPAAASVPETLPGHLDDVTSQGKTLNVTVKTRTIRWIKDNKSAGHRSYQFEASYPVLLAPERLPQAHGGRLGIGIL